MAKPKKAAPSLLDQIQPTDPSKKSKNPNIILESIDAKLVDDYRQVCLQMKNLESQKNEMNGRLRTLGQEHYAERADNEGVLENLKLLGEEGSVTYIVQKNCAKVSADAKETIDAEGLGQYVVKDQIQLCAGLSEQIQERILQSLAKEFGTKELTSLVTTQYKVQETALVEIAKTGNKKTILSALQLLNPVQQIRTG